MNEYYYLIRSNVCNYILISNKEMSSLEIFEYLSYKNYIDCTSSFFSENFDITQKSNISNLNLENYTTINVVWSFYNPLDTVMSFGEATDLWELGESTLRSVINQKRVNEGIDFRKSKNTWLITKETMKKLYGELKK